MPPIDPTQIQDLVNNTIPNYKRQIAAHLAKQFTRLTGLSTFFRKGRVADEFTAAGRGGVMSQNPGGGWQYDFPVLTSTAGAASHVGLYASSTGAVQKHIDRCQMPLRISRTRYDWDDIEAAMNSGEAQIANIIMGRQVAALTDLVELIELAIWGAPTDNTDVVTPYGIGHAVTTGTTAGFTGTFQSGFTTKYGSTSTALNNYWNSFTNVSFDDLVAKVDLAMLSIGFQPYQYVTGIEEKMPRYRMFTGQTNILALRQLGRAQNANQPAPYDLMIKDGMITINGVPVEYAPAIDTIDATLQTAQRPFYILDMAYWYPFRLGQYWMKQTDPMKDRDQPLVNAKFWHCVWGLVCEAPKYQAKLTYSAS